MSLFDRENCGVFILFCIWLLVNAGDALWIYYYVQAAVNPNPRTAVNRSRSGWGAYYVMMFIFGFFWGLVNLAFFVLYFTDRSPFFSSTGWYYDPQTATSKDRLRLRLRKSLIWLNLILVGPIAVLMILGPFVGPFVALPLAQQYAWDHRCDPYPLMVVLDSRGYYDPRYTPDVATFYVTGQTSDLFTNDIAQSGNDVWSFGLRTLDSSAIPDQAFPRLRKVDYDFVGNTVTGNCTAGTAAGGNTTTTTACLQGSFNPGDFLSFNLTSSVPFGPNSTSTAAPTTSYLRTVDREWTFSDDAPSLILRSVNVSDDSLVGDIVLRTAVTKKGDCTQLKVCVNGVAGREIGAEVLVPVGLILLRQSDYAVFCTTPTGN